MGDRLCHIPKMSLGEWQTQQDLTPPGTHITTHTPQLLSGRQDHADRRAEPPEGRAELGCLLPLTFAEGVFGCSCQEQKDLLKKSKCGCKWAFHSTVTLLTNGTEQRGLLTNTRRKKGKTCCKPQRDKTYSQSILCPKRTRQGSDIPTVCTTTRTIQTGFLQ